MSKPIDDADRAKAGTLQSDPPADTERAKPPIRVVRPDERRQPDEPCDLASEKALLGALLWAGANQPDALRVQSVRDIIDAGKVFYDRRNALTFDAIRACADEKQEHDPVAVYQQTARRGVRGHSLDDLWAIVADASTVSERQARVYAQTIRDTWARRTVIRDARGLIEDAKSGKTAAAELLTRAKAVAAQFAARAATGAGVVSAKESAAALFTMLQGQVCTAMTTGLRDLDRALNGGLRPGETSVLAARTNVGKSALAAGIARHMGSRVEKTGVLYVSLEMQHTSFMARLVSAQAGVPLSAIRQLALAPYMTRLTGVIAQIAKEDLYFADNPTQTMSAIYGSALDCSRRLARDGKRLGMVVIDHIGLVKPSADALKRANREQQVAETSRAMRFIAQEIGCHVMGLAQIARAAE